MQESEAIEFEPFRLDLLDESLWRQDERLSLTPKAFAVLRHLVDHAGRLVTRNNLFETVWPEAYVSDDVLTVCIRELRQVLGDQARSPQYIETVRGRGYRFVATVTRGAQDVPGIETGEPRSTRLPVPSLMVARDGELEALHGEFEHMLRGQRQMVFISGEAGIGKTTLLDAFVAQVASRMQLWVGRGQCIDHYGAGEPYLPLLDVLGQLSRGPGGEQFISIVGRQAPSWLCQMPALVSTSESEAIERWSQGATQVRMLRELAEAVEALSAVRPVVLVLEDLHWSDHATLDWLNFVAHRRVPARLLVLGTYRPADAIVQSHPVGTVTQELQRQGCGVDLALDYLSPDGVAAYLAHRLDQVSLPGRFVELLHQRTNGNPFFLVTMVDELIRQGVLVQHSAGWCLEERWDARAVEVPDSVQHLIEQQLGTLSSEARELLERASVAGAEFPAAAIAGEQAIEHADTQCSVLARGQQFVQAQGVTTWPDGTVSGRYRFIHALYQEILYGQIPVSRRLRLHRQIGERLETGYGAETHQIAAELAAHFVQGRDVWRAITYLQLAGENALRRSAHQEAVEHLTQGLSLLQTLPETAERFAHELAVQTALGPALMAHKGYAAPEVERAYFRARELCQHLGDTPQLFPSFRGLWVFYLLRAELETAHELGEQLLALAQRAQDSGLLLEAHFASGQSALWYSGLAPARAHLEQGIALYNPERHRSHALRYGQDPGVFCRAIVALVLWFQGYPDQALQRASEALTLAQELAHPNSLAAAMYFVAWIHQLRRQVQQAREQAESLLALARAQGLPFWEAGGLIWLGWAEVAQGQGNAGLTHLCQGLAAWQDTGSALAQPQYQALLAEAYGHVGQPDTGLTVLTETLKVVARTGDRIWEAELYRLKGQLLLAGSRDHGREAEKCLYQALDLARHHQAKSWELRAAVSLAQLWRSQGKYTEAYDVLAPVYAWFTEGFDTADFQQARALLEALAY